MVTSTNGTNWTILPTVGLSTYWYDVAYGNGTWIAVVSRNTIVISTDNGLTWTVKTLGTSAWHVITYVNERWIALGKDGGIATSTDGISWSIQEVGLDPWYEVAYGHGMWIVVGYNADGYSNIVISTNGTNWTTKRVGAANWYSVAHGNGIWVAVGVSGNNNVAFSTNGTDWQTRRIHFRTGSQHVTYANGLFMSFGYDFAISVNGRDWTFGRKIDSDRFKASKSYYDQQFRNTAYNSVAHNNCRWVAVNTNGNMAISVDNGFTWTVGKIGVNECWYDITYANGVWVAVGNNNSACYYLGTSTDNGISWSIQSLDDKGHLGNCCSRKDTLNYPLII
jgi:hypothetical protein